MTYVIISQLLAALPLPPLEKVERDGGEIILSLDIPRLIAIDDTIIYTAPSGQKYFGYVLEIVWDGTLYQPQYLAYVAYFITNEYWSGWSTSWLTLDCLEVVADER